MTTATPDYLSSAFYSQYNLILLGGSALFALASASPLPLAIGAAAELVWLGLGPRLPVFRRRIEQQLEGERRALQDDELAHAMRGLGTEHSARLLAVGQAISVIMLHAPDAHEPVMRAALVELESLRPTFLHYCQLHERLSQRLQEMVLAPPQQEAQMLAQAYAAEKDLGARFTLHQSLKLAQKKTEQQARMTDMRRSIELKLVLVEQSLAHLHQQLSFGVVAAELARDMSGLVAQVGTAARLEAELADGGALSASPPSVAPR